MTIQDQQAIPNPAGGSFDASRLIHPFSALPDASRRWSRGLAAWELLWRDLGRQLLVPCGVVTLPPCSADGVVAARHGLASVGIHVEPLTGEALARQLPEIILPAHATALFHASSGVLLAQDILVSLVGYVHARGAKIEAFRQARPDDLGRIAGDADVTILAGGAWNPGSLSILDPSLARRLTPVRQIMLYLRSPPARAGGWASSAAFVGLGGDDELWGVPPIGAAPLKLAVGAVAHAVAAPEPDRAPTEKEIADVLGHFAPFIPGLERAALIDARSCHYTRAASSDWLVERVPTAASPTWLFGGCNGSGFKSAPAAALGLVETVLAA